MMPADVPASPDPARLEEIAAFLEASPDYRVLRRITLRPPLAVLPGTPTRLGLLLDLETTGLDPEQDEIIEMAMLPFTYGLDGTVYAVGEPFSQLRQPAKPLSPVIQALTGLTDEMLEGQSIDPADVVAFLEPASLIIAHNAGFDRRFAEAFCDAFAAKPWACSLYGVDWATEGFEGSKLGYLAMRHGLFFEGHRALHDCQATLEILARPLFKSGVTALARLLTTARQPSWRIWAVDAPYHHKDTLKARGYRWNDGGNGQPKAWFIDVPEASQETECSFLCEAIYGHTTQPLMRRVTAHERFSIRA